MRARGMLAGVIAVVMVLFRPVAGQQTMSIVVGGATREFLVDVPSGYDGSRQFGLVMCFHGLGGNASGTRLFARFQQWGGSDSFIAVYPQGLLIDSPLQPGTQATGWSFELVNNRDVTFVESLLDTLFRRYEINASAVFVTGISNGGYFSDILGCRIGDRLAAIAPVIGGYPLLQNCSLSKNLSVLHLATEFDGIVDIAHVRSATAFWVNRNGCDQTGSQSGICMSYSGCDDGSEVSHCEFQCLVSGAPAASPNTACHTYPFTYTGYAFDATELILDFFRRHGLGTTTGVIAQPRHGPPSSAGTARLAPGALTRVYRPDGSLRAAPGRSRLTGHTTPHAAVIVVDTEIGLLIRRVLVRE